MKNFLFLAISAMMLLGTASCSDQGAGACTNSFPYVSVGHIRSYYITSSRYSSDTTMDVVINASNNSYTYQVRTISYPYGDYSSLGYLLPCGDLMYASSVSAAEADKRRNVARRQNPNEGDTWSYTETNTYNYKVLKKNVSVTVPASATPIQCDMISYTPTDSSRVDTIYYNPSIGEVKYSGFAFSYVLKSKNF